MRALVGWVSSFVAIALAVAGCGASTAETESANAEGDEPRAAFFADAEALHEEGLSSALRDAADAFGSIDVSLAASPEGALAFTHGESAVSLIEREEEGAWVIEAASRTFRIERTDEDWEASTRVALEVLDHVLASIGAPQRAYAQYFGGNEQIICLLRPAERRLMDSTRPREERLVAAR